MAGDPPSDAPKPVFVEQPVHWTQPSPKFNNPTILDDSNYLKWAAETRILLESCDVFEVVDGTESKPETDHYKNWIRKDRFAKGQLMSLVCSEKRDIITNAQTAHEAWKELQNQLDRKNVSSVFSTFNTLLDFTKDPSDTIRDHINKFESAFSRVVDKVQHTKDTDKKYLRGLKMCMEDPELKAQLLLRSFRTGYENVVENLEARPNIEYNIVREHFLDLGSKKDEINGSAMYSNNKQKQKKKSNSRTSSNSAGSTTSNTSQSDEYRKGIPPKDECSWCWKRNKPSKGHTHTSCSLLAQNRSAPKPSTGSAKVAAEDAAATDIAAADTASQSAGGDDITTGFALVASSSAYRLTCPPQITLPSGSALKTSEKHIYEIQSLLE